MSRKTPEQRAIRREEARHAAEADARSMLLAAGYADDEEAGARIREILAGGPGPGRLLYTIQDFCDMVRISQSTFFRLRREGRGPAVVHVLGQPRIKAETVAEWVAANAVPEAPAGGGAEPTPRRRRTPTERVVVPRSQPDAKRVPSMFDPPPRKRRPTAKETTP